MNVGRNVYAGFLQAKKTDLGTARDLDVSDLHVEVIDLLANRVEAELGVAFFIACYSALKKAPVSPALLILGDMSVQGNIKPLRSLVEPLRVAKDNGGKRALIPIENKRNFLGVSTDIMEHVDPIFFGDPKTAALKVIGGSDETSSVSFCLCTRMRREICPRCSISGRFAKTAQAIVKASGVLHFADGLRPPYPSKEAIVWRAANLLILQSSRLDPHSPQIRLVQQRNRMESS